MSAESKTIHKDLGKTLKEHREKAGLTQLEVAKKAGQIIGKFHENALPHKIKEELEED